MGREVAIDRWTQWLAVKFRSHVITSMLPSASDAATACVTWKVALLMRNNRSFQDNRESPGGFGVCH
eukprot:6262680-Amphidinium_carterae.2